MLVSMNIFPGMRERFKSGCKVDICFQGTGRIRTGILDSRWEDLMRMRWVDGLSWS